MILLGTLLITAAGFEHPRTKYKLATGILLFPCAYSCGFANNPRITGKFCSDRLLVCIADLIRLL